MAIYNTLFYKNEAGDNFLIAEAGDIETHCLDGENLVPKTYKEVWIYWDTDLLQWVETNVYTSTDFIQTLIALRVDNPCDDTFAYLFLGQGYTANDFRLAQACCASIPCGDPLIVGTLPNFAIGVPYNATLQIGGRGPFSISGIGGPAWMTIDLDEETGLITFSGTPTEGSEDATVSFDYGNCGEDTNPNEFSQEISLVLAFVARAMPRSISTVRHNGTDMFVAGSVNSDVDCLFTSPDGINWTPRTMPVACSIGAIAFGNGVWLAAGIQTGSAAGVLFKSVDNGVTWTGPTSLGVGFDLPRGMAYGGGRFVVVGAAGNRARYSTDDGASWTDGTGIPGIAVNAVVYNGLVFCCVAGSGAIFTSSNGAAWTSRTPGWVNNAEHQKVITDADFVVFAVTRRDLEYGISNAQIWDVVAPAAAQIPEFFKAVSISNGVGNVYAWVIAAENSTAYIATDNGNTWKKCIVPAGYNFNDLIFVPSMNLFVGAASANGILTAAGLEP